MQRIKELDYLRGLAAISIMCYHYMKWLYEYDGAQSFIGRLGVYGVEIFYILSGITLFHVYHNTISLEKQALIQFFSKRFFRIFPLFWLSIALTILIGFKQISLLKLFTNASGLFGFIAWDTYIAAGSWSIGNELVFYFLFPILIFLYANKPLLFAGVGLIFLIIYHYFAFYIFNPKDSLHNQWSNYVNPLNHLFLFYAGMVIPAFLKNQLGKNKLAVLLIIVGCCMLFMYPSGFDGIHLLYGIKRWIFTIGAMLICIGFYLIKLTLPNLLDRALNQLGEISFGVYLLHPIVYQLLCILIRKAQPYYAIPQSNKLLMLMAIFLTFITSKLVYKFYELYFIKKGAKLTANFYKS